VTNHGDVPEAATGNEKRPHPYPGTRALSDVLISRGTTLVQQPSNGLPHLVNPVTPGRRSRLLTDVRRPRSPVSSAVNSTAALAAALSLWPALPVNPGANRAPVDCLRHRFWLIYAC